MDTVFKGRARRAAQASSGMRLLTENEIDALRFLGEAGYSCTPAFLACKNEI